MAAPRKEKRMYKATGPMNNAGEVIPQEYQIRWAYSPQQMREIVRALLKKDPKYNRTAIYLGGCTIEDVTGNRKWIA